MLTPVQTQVLFLYEFKLGHNAVEAGRNINLAFGEGTVNEQAVQIWFQKFCSENGNVQSEPQERSTNVSRDDRVKKKIVEDNHKITT